MKSYGYKLINYVFSVAVYDLLPPLDQFVDAILPKIPGFGMVVVSLPAPFLGMGCGSTPWSPSNWATPHGQNQSSRSEREWPNMAQRRWSSTGQSSTR